MLSWLPQRHPGENSEQNDRPGWISEDGCRLYISTQRPGAGESDIYVATRPL